MQTDTQISYSFASQTDDTVARLVMMDEATGELFLRQKVDFDALVDSKQLLVIVNAADGGSPPLTASTIIMINVMDENDNAPLIQINCATSRTRTR